MAAMTPEQFWAEHYGHRVAARPTVVDGWDARFVECDDHPLAYALEMRAMPAEGILIDPDPHLQRLDGCICTAVRGAHKPPCAWAA